MRLHLTNIDFNFGHFLLAAVVFLVIVYAWKGISGRHLVATGLGTYAIVTDEGLKRILPVGRHFIWKPYERVLKGKFAPALSFRMRGSADDDVHKSFDLLDRNTGRINLRIQHFSCPVFLVSTRELKERLIYVSLSFRLDRDILRNALMYQDFGETLQARVEEAFRETISDYQDENIGKSKSEIIERVLYYLDEPEERARSRIGGFEPDKSRDHKFQKTSLGIRIVEIGFYIPSSRGVEQSRGEAVENDTRLTRSMEDVNTEKLDSIRDQFLMENWEQSENVKDKEAHYHRASEMMYKVLELQSQQNTARSLVESGSLIVLSSAEMGLRGNVLEEPISYLAQDFMSKK